MEGKPLAEFVGTLIRGLARLGEDKLKQDEHERKLKAFIENKVASSGSVLVHLGVIINAEDPDRI